MLNSRNEAAHTGRCSTGQVGLVYSQERAMNQSPPPVNIAKEDIYDLTYAKMLLENPGLTARIANILGAPIEKGFALLPEDWAGTVQNAVRAALFRALDLALSTINPRSRGRASEFMRQGDGGRFGRRRRGVWPPCPGDRTPDLNHDHAPFHRRYRPNGGT